MSNPIKSPMEALSVAVKIVDAQDKLLAAYRIGSLRPPEAALDYLTKHKPRLAAWREESLRAAAIVSVPSTPEQEEEQ